MLPADSIRQEAKKLGETQILEKEKDLFWFILCEQVHVLRQGGGAASGQPACGSRQQKSGKRSQLPGVTILHSHLIFVKEFSSVITG